MTWPALSWHQVPSVPSAALRTADAEARSRFGIEPMQLMEIAGWQVARFVEAYLAGVRGRRVLFVAGAGNNGGDALAAARFLHLRGAVVSVSMVASRDRGSLAAHHATTIERMGIPVRAAPDGIDQATDAIVDGLLGTGVRPPLREPAQRIIRAMQATGRPILAIDVPSGLDADTGKGADAAIRAVATLTLAAPKPGLERVPNAGRVFVADLGMPPALFGDAAEAVAALYAMGDLVELVDPELPSNS